MSTLLNSISYYQDNEAVLVDLVNELVERTSPEAGDVPAFTFAVLVESLGKDRDKAVTIAALAAMRLGEMKNVAKQLAEANRIVEAARAWRRDVDPRYGEASAEALCKAVDDLERTTTRPNSSGGTQ